TTRAGAATSAPARLSPAVRSMDDVSVKIWLDAGWQDDGGVYRNQFELTPLDWCARYVLHVRTKAPVTVLLRGETVASGDAPEATADVTDWVNLDDNLLEIWSSVEPGAVWLE